MDDLKKMVSINKNENGDVYTITELEFSEKKKRNMEYWDSIDDESRIFLEKLASMVGIDIKEWGDEDAIKEIVDIATNLIEKRFEVKYPFVDENY